MSMSYGHSLKGYQWIDNKGIVLMSFTFKDLTLDIWQDTTKGELEEFKEYIDSNGWEIHHVVYNDHKVKESN